MSPRKKETKGKEMPKEKKGPKMPEVEMVVIEVKRASAIGLPGLLNKEGITLDYGVRLLPGENDVPKDIWERVRTHKTVKMYLDCDILFDHGPGKARKLTDGLDALEKFQAIAQIEKCDAPKILKDWYSKTSKIDLRNKLQDKLTAIEAEKSKKE